jgi:hypothetical protein
VHLVATEKFHSLYGAGDRATTFLAIAEVQRTGDVVLALSVDGSVSRRLDFALLEEHRAHYRVAAARRDAGDLTILLEERRPERVGSYQTESYSGGDKARLTLYQ